MYTCILNSGVQYGFEDRDKEVAHVRVKRRIKGIVIAYNL